MPSQSAACQSSDAEAEGVLERAARVARENARRTAAAEPTQLVPPTLEQRVLRLREEAEKSPPPAAPEIDEAARRRRMLVAQSHHENPLPPRYAAASLEDWERVPEMVTEELGGGSRRSWDVRRRYQECTRKLARLLDAPAMVALLGRRGPGKTHMACALVNAFRSRERHALYLDAMDYFIELQETYDDHARRSQSAVEKKYLAPELLVLDAMEERADTAWNDRMLVRLIDKRYKAELSTVLISNEEVPAFNARVGPSIADRIRDDGGRIECAWPSLRGRIQRKGAQPA